MILGVFWEAESTEKQHTLFQILADSYNPISYISYISDFGSTKYNPDEMKTTTVGPQNGIWNSRIHCPSS